jgi:hypothetical protein
VRDHAVALLLQRLQLRVERVEPLLARLVGLLRECGPLDLELANTPLDHVDLEGHRVDLDAQARRRLVDKVDRLVGKLAARDVPIREHGRRDQRRVLDAHTVVHFVALLEAAQDRDRVLHRGLADVDRLESAFERRILLDVLAVLVERGRADHAQLAAREQRLDHVAGIDRTFGTAGADDRVQLVDERDHFAVGVGDLLQDRLEPLLELAAVLGARDHRADVERDHSLVTETVGDVALDDATGESFDDGRLAHPRLADQHRIVLGAARQHLDDPADLLVAPDYGVDLPRACGLGEVAAVLLERLVLVFGVVARDAMRTPHLTERIEHGIVGDPERTQEISDATGDVGHREQEVLGRQVLVVELRALLVGRLEELERGGRERCVAHGRAAHLRPATERFVDANAHRAHVDADALEHAVDDTLGLLEQRAQEVFGRDLGVTGLSAGRLRGADRLLGLACELVGIECHGLTFSRSRVARRWRCERAPSRACTDGARPRRVRSSRAAAIPPSPEAGSPGGGRRASRIRARGSAARLPARCPRP